MQSDIAHLPRLVLDTNVALDLLHFADPAALPILRALEAGRAQSFVTAETLDELQRVVNYPEFGLNPSAQAEMLARYRAGSRLVATPAPKASLPRCRDPDDQPFLDLAAAVEADVLVSKDRALLKLARWPNLGFRILTPDAAREMLMPRTS